MTVEELAKACNKEIKEGRATLVTSRICKNPDVEGVISLIKEFPNIHIINLARNFFDDSTTEKFYELHNEELAKEARKILEKEWL